MANQRVKFVKTALEAYRRADDCPRCGGADWFEGNSTIVLAAMQPDQRAVDVGIPGLSVAALICSRCMFVALHLIPENIDELVAGGGAGEAVFGSVPGSGD